MKNFRLPNRNLTAFAIVLILIIYVMSKCEKCNTVFDMQNQVETIEKFDLVQIKLYGKEEIIVAEATGRATGAYLIDFSISTPLGDFDPGTVGNRSVTFDNELIRLKIGYDSTTTYFSEDAVGSFTEQGDSVTFAITSRYIPPKILDVIPEGFARQHDSYFTGSVSVTEFNEFLHRRAKEKGDYILNQYEDQIRNYTEKMLFSQFQRMLTPFFPGKHLKILIEFDGRKVQEGLDGHILNLDIEDVSLDTTIKHTKVFGTLGHLQFRKPLLQPNRGFRLFKEKIYCTFLPTPSPLSPLFSPATHL